MHRLLRSCIGLALRSTISSSDQAVIPAAIRERFDCGPSQRLGWLVEEDGSIRVLPVVAPHEQVFRGRDVEVAPQRGAWRIESLIEKLSCDAGFRTKRTIRDWLAH